MPHGHLEFSSIGVPSVGRGFAYKGYPLILSGTIFVSRTLWCSFAHLSQECCMVTKVTVS